MIRPGWRLRDEAGAALLLAAFCAFWFADTVADPDLWGHVRFGQDLLRTGSIVRADTYSYRADGQPWINHEWLAEVAFAWDYDHLGSAGLIGGKLAVALGILGACLVHLRRGGMGALLAAALLILASIPFRMGMGTIRPQLFTYLGYLILLLILHGARDRPAPRRLWLLPPLLALWVNLHGGVLAGSAVAAIWIVARMIRLTRRGGVDQNRRDLAVLGGLAVACGVSLMINPWGWGLIAFLLRTATVPRLEISEWAPLAPVSLPGGIVLGLMVAGLASVATSRRRPQPESLVVLVASSVLPLAASRHYPLFALALVVIGGESMADAWERARALIGVRRERRSWITALCLAASLVLATLVPGRLNCIRLDPYFFNFPARAVEYLRRGQAEGNMAVPFDWGEYVLWHLGPRVRVSMDGRRETLYAEDEYRRAREFERGTEAWDELLRTGPRTDLILTPVGSPTVPRLAREDDWVPLYRDRTCVVFVRKGMPGLDRLLGTPIPTLPDDGGGLCFPGPRDQPPGGSKPSARARS
ncbi:hypothetical protein [Aquisphaera insulae]|uniref:hypothetical protein n=1 Tax=Aquisphaera insulae TaxID=2712864 RepID=UPI0013EA8988|nr:hypothetical protein [Aquisphaera insulae]